MVQLAFATFAYDRVAPASRLVNLFVEPTPQSPTESARLPRPGLVSTYTWGSGPIRGLFRQAGIGSGGLFAVSLTTAYLAGSSVGTIGGSDLVRWAAGRSQVVAVASGTAYAYAGASFAAITDSDLPNVSDVVYFAGRFVYSVVGSDRFYWSDPNDATSVDGLNYATAESSSDPIVGMATLGAELFLFGSGSVESWSENAGATDPTQTFQPNPTQFARGCAARDTIQKADNALFWLGDDRVVYRTGNVPERVSTHGIEDKLRQCAGIASCTAWTATVDGHALYVLNIAGIGSFALDIQTGGWSEWQSYGKTVFRGRCSASVDGSVYVGDDTAATIWKLTPGAFLDGADSITFEATAFYPTNARFERCNRLTLLSSKGVGLTTGQGSDPVVEMRFSDDLGKTWCDWRQGSLGKIGEYSRRVSWQRLGPMRVPGRLFQVRCTDPVLFTASGLNLNEAA